MMTMGKKILNMRKARGWSQEELAGRVGVTRQAVSRWESDAAKPDADKIIAICDLFGVSADYLLRDQYASTQEGSAASPPQTSALSNAVRGMSLRQWAGVFSVLMGLLVMFVIKILHVISDSNYYYEADGVKSTGFMAFLAVEELGGILALAFLAVVIGIVILLVIPVIEKDQKRLGWTKDSD